MTENTIDQQEDVGFRVLNPGTLNVKFNVYDYALRDRLSDEDVIDYREAYLYNDKLDEAAKDRINQRAVFTMSQFVASCNLTQLLQKIESNTNAELAPFYAALAPELDNYVKTAQEQFSKTKELSYDMLPFVLTPEMILVVTGNDEVQHGGRILRVSAHTHREYGRYFEIELGILGQNTVGEVVLRAVTKYVINYAGNKTLNELGFAELTDDLKAAFAQRAKKFDRLIKKPSYMRYAGSIVRRTERTVTRFRARGRVMVDMVTMGTIDPSYEKFYGTTEGSRGIDSADLLDFDVLTGNNQYIVTPYVYGFSFVAKQWGEMLVDNVEDIQFRKDSFDKLVLDTKLKAIVRDLVKANMMDLSSVDIIDGKGGGTIFMLDGMPGIGKTLTAEALAEQLQMPLYIVSTGELGTEPETLAHKLREILEICSTWNAILLIDEADIYMEQRTKEDIHRNAMVGVFLQMLEYYQGILFLTTNRVANMDRAFRSRISLSMHYPKLNHEARFMIWCNLLNEVQDVELDLNFTQRALHQLAKRKLNGREIKHFVNTAYKMAMVKEEPLSIGILDELFRVSKDYRIKGTLWNRISNWFKELFE